MATPLATAFVRIRPDTTGFQQATAQGISKSGLAAQGTKHGKLFGANFGKSAAKWIGSTIGIFGAASAVTTIFNAMQNLQREQALLGQALKTTGGVARVNQKHILGLAASISGYSGQSKVAILQGSRLLLSFTSVRNEVGKNNDIYDQAIKMSANLAAATGRDMPQAAKMLGKALQDPATGMTALRRAGVVFTAQQTEQIKKMQANGNLMGAQKLILDQLAVRYGGAAKAAGETFGGQMNRLRNLLVGFGVVAMKIVLPFLTKVIGAFLRMPRPIQTVIVAVGALGIALKLLSVSNPFTAIAMAILTLAMLAWKYRKQIMQAFLTAWAAIKSAWSVTVNFLSRTWNGLVQSLRNAFAWFVGKILGFFGSILHGAAVAFGWIPGLGGKLKAADKAFAQFARNVTSHIRGIQGTTVTVGVRMTAKTNPYPGGISGRAAGGLFIRRGTGPTADDVLVAASRGELIVPASLVRAGAVDHLRGRIPGFAAGGPVGVNVRSQFPSGREIRSTLIGAVRSLATDWAKSAATALGGGGGRGLPGSNAGWTAVILKALALLHQSAAWLPIVYRRLMQESGGNASVVNRWDSNWLAGTPSVGGMQVIGPTFRAYAGPFRNVGPFLYGVSVNRLANMYAGLNYALHRYGSLAALSQPGGYAGGGLITEPILGVGRSGRTYTFGERGIERVTPGAGPAGDLGPLLARLDRLIAAAERAPARTAGGLAEALNRTGRRAAYGGMYGS